jgi:hypothetical protein
MVYKMIPDLALDLWPLEVLRSRSLIHSFACERPVHHAGRLHFQAETRYRGPAGSSDDLGCRGYAAFLDGGDNL